MNRENFNDLFAFTVVAREGSFTRAGAKLRVSASALSHTMKGLESRLGVRLLSRTTRSVSLTEAGERLLNDIEPRFAEITHGIDALSTMREHPSGHIRLTSTAHSLQQVLWPKLVPFMQRYPDIHIELNTDFRLVDIVAERYDAGVRIGEHVAKDMVAVRIGADFRAAIVGAPSYFENYPIPKTPKDLAAHRCINLRLPTHGGLLVWDFEKNGHSVNVQPEGQLIMNHIPSMIDAALHGLGLMFTPEDTVENDLKEGRLIRVLEDWCPMFPGYYLYYPSNRQMTPAFSILLDALRYTRK